MSISCILGHGICFYSSAVLLVESQVRHRFFAPLKWENKKKGQSFSASSLAQSGIKEGPRVKNGTPLVTTTPPMTFGFIKVESFLY